MKKMPYSLVQLQSLPLEQKIILTKARIYSFYSKMKGNIVLSFSGGKDSTVLLHIARGMYPNLKAVFSDTGLEYPEVKDFVKSVQNVEIIRPEKTFRRIITEDGYPVVSKIISQAVREARKFDGKKYSYRINQFEGKNDFANYSKHKHLLTAPFKISERCCNHLKKNPFKKYQQLTKAGIMVATLAAESSQRKNTWLRNGCETVQEGKAKLAPLSFWTEQDILEYIFTRKIQIPAIYGKVIFTDKFELTGIKRTGCMWCLFGMKYDGEENRIDKIKAKYPKIFDYMMKPVEEGGLGYEEVLIFLAKHKEIELPVSLRGSPIAQQAGLRPLGSQLYFPF